MNALPIRWIWLLSCTLAFALPGFAAATERSARSVFEDIPALTKPVTYTETKIPLGELVQKVAEDTGVTLTASKDVADEPVAVVVKELPARELLEQLAELLGYRWSRRGRDAGTGRRGDGETRRRGDAGKRDPARDDLLNTQHPTPNTQHPPSTLNTQHSTLAPPARFEIWQDLASKQREEALRRSVFQAAERRLREELERTAAVAALSQEQIEEILKAAEQHRKERQEGTPDRPQEVRRSPEEAERERRFRIAEELRAPIDRSLARLLGSLSARQWAVLRREGQITFSSDPQPGEPRLPGAIEHTFRTSAPVVMRPGTVITLSDSSGVIPPGDPRWSERLREHEKELKAQWSSATGYRVKLRFDTERLATNGAISLGARTYPILAGGARRVHIEGGILYVAAGAVDALQPEEPEPQPGDEEREQDPVLGAKKRFQPEVRPRPLPYGPGAGAAWLPRDLLPELARTYGAQFIADAYWDTPSVTAAQVITPEPVSLAALLDRITGSEHRWEQKGKLIRLRSRSWFFERPREVPLRFVRRWKELFEKHRALSLDAYAEIVTALSERQVEGLVFVDLDAGLSEHFRAVYPSQHALRLYAALTPPQRQALWRGEPLPVTAMLPHQRALFLTTVRERNRYRPNPLDLSQWMAGSFSLTRPAPPAPPQTGPQAPVAPVHLTLEYGPNLRERFILTVAAPS